MTLLELRRALGALFLMSVFGSTFVAHKEDDEHDERKSKTRMLFTSEMRKVRDTTLSSLAKPLV